MEEIYFDIYYDVILIRFNDNIQYLPLCITIMFSKKNVENIKS